MKRIIAGARRAMSAIGWIEVAAGSLLVLIIFVLMLLQIGLRYYPVFNGVFVGEIARFALVWLTFAVAGYLVSKSEHPVIETIDLVAKGPWRRAVIVGSNIIIVVISVYFALDVAELVFNSGTQSTPVLGVPMSLVYAVPMTGFILTAIHAVIRAAIFAAHLEEEGDNAINEQGPAIA